MGIKEWFGGRSSQTYLRYAAVYAPPIEELAAYLAAALVAFSGQESVTESTAVEELIFENPVRMLTHGFESNFGLSAALISVPQMSQHELFGNAYKQSVAIICRYITSMVRKKLRSEVADQFLYYLESAIAGVCAGRYGFPKDHDAASAVIQRLMPAYNCETMLNLDFPGSDDALGQLLRNLNRSDDGKVCYCFSVGSKNQPIGCGAPFIKVLNNVNENIGRCVRELA